MFSITKRHIQLYFHRKITVFFSLMGAWIAFALYLVFLQKNMQEDWSKVADYKLILDNWVIGGTLAVTSITTTWTGMGRMVKDKESHKIDDFLLTDLSRFKLNLSYLLSASIVGVLMQVIMFAIMSVYFYWQDKLVVAFDKFPQLCLIMILSSFLGASLGGLIVQRVKSVDVVSRLSTIIGTASGFLVGVYMPIGALPSYAQNLVKLFPGAYVAAIYRQILTHDQLEGLSFGIREYLGIGIKWSRLIDAKESIILIIIVTLVSLFFTYIGQLVKVRKLS